MRLKPLVRLSKRLPTAASPHAPLMKTATYCVMHLVVAMAVAYALSGSWAIALGIGLIEPAVQTVAYTLHERAWRRAAQDTAPAPSAQAAAKALRPAVV